MKKKEDQDTRYYIELDLATGKVIGWDYGQRFDLIKQLPAKPSHHRIYLTKGQYNKLVQRHEEMGKKK